MNPVRNGECMWVPSEHLRRPDSWTGCKNVIPEDPHGWCTNCLVNENTRVKNAMTRFVRAHILSGPKDDSFTVGVVDIYEFLRAESIVI